ncbi:MAG: hypothetical protein HRU40_11365 [Saprospiraceae bacterium]|nr:hypothetical protein [Saprospiraceae bacterium]
MKERLLRSPEYYLIILFFMAGYSTPFYVNPVCLCAALIIGVQLFIQYKHLGLIIGLIFFILNLCFLGALLSEFSAFQTFNSAAAQLLGVGLIIWIINLLFVALMIRKYLIMPSTKNSLDLS